MKRKRSFLERFTGAIRISDDADEEDEEEEVEIVKAGDKSPVGIENELEIGDGELMVDVFQTSTDIVIKTMVPGVRPEDLDITITRDMVTVKGKREIERTITEDNYFHKELYWGSFSRTILLPQEVQIEDAEAFEKHGLLIIRLPKLDKHRQSKLRVRNNS